MTDTSTEAVIRCAECTCQSDDHGRRDLTGGLGYVLIGAMAFWLAFAGWLIWRFM